MYAFVVQGPDRQVAPRDRGRARRRGERLHLAEAVDVVAQERSVLLDDHHRHLVEADRRVGVVVAVAGEPRRRQRLAQPARPVGLGEAVRPDPDRGVDEDQGSVLVHRHEVDPADALGPLPGLVDDLVALALEEGLDRAHRLFLHVVHVLLLRL